MGSAMIEMLAQVLSPFPEGQRATMIKWIEHEMEAYPLIDCVTSTDDVTWTLGEKSPSNNSAAVFAMLYNEALRGVIIYSVNVTPVEGGANGQAQFEYFREVCFNPKHMHGPISGNALYMELRTFVAVDFEDPENPGPPLNGAGATAAS